MLCNYFVRSSELSLNKYARTLYVEIDQIELRYAEKKS